MMLESLAMVPLYTNIVLKDVSPDLGSSIKENSGLVRHNKKPQQSPAGVF
jgi:hypothetical protein